jgi:hypothetical protein
MTCYALRSGFFLGFLQTHGLRDTYEDRSEARPGGSGGGCPARNGRTHGLRDIYEDRSEARPGGSGEHSI